MTISSSAGDTAAPPAVDPITLTVIWNTVLSIAEELGVTLRNTAFSEGVREGDDFATAMFDRNAVMIAQGNFSPGHLGSMAQGCAGGVFEGVRNDPGKTGQRDDIQHVVMEDRQQAGHFARADVVEIDMRDHRAGHVTLALHAEHALFEFNQTATLVTQLPQPARAVQQVQVVIHARERRPRADPAAGVGRADDGRGLAREGITPTRPRVGSAAALCSGRR